MQKNWYFEKVANKSIIFPKCLFITRLSGTYKEINPIQLDVYKIGPKFVKNKRAIPWTALPYSRGGKVAKCAYRQKRTKDFVEN